MIGKGKGGVRAKSQGSQEEKLLNSVSALINEFVTFKDYSFPWVIDWKKHPQLTSKVENFKTQPLIKGFAKDIDNVATPLKWMDYLRSEIQTLDSIANSEEDFPDLSNMIRQVFVDSSMSAPKESVFVPNLFTLGFLLALHNHYGFRDKPDTDPGKFFYKLMYPTAHELKTIYNIQNSLLVGKPVSSADVALIHVSSKVERKLDPELGQLESIGIFLKENGFITKSHKLVLLKQRQLQSTPASQQSSHKRKRDVEDDDDEVEGEFSLKAVDKFQVSGRMLALFLLLVLPMAVVALVYGAIALQHKHHECREDGHKVKFSVAVWLVVLGSIGCLASLLALFDWYLNMPGSKQSPDTQTLMYANRWIIVLGLLFVLAWTATGAALYAEAVNHGCRSSPTGKVTLSAIIIHGLASLLSLIWIVFKTKCCDAEPYAL